METYSFDTYPYVASHARDPRGRGSWAFVPRVYYRDDDYLTKTFFSPSMTYTEAKKWYKQATAHTANGIYQDVLVLP